MAEYIDRTQLEPDTEWNDYDDGFASYSQSQIRSMSKADVIERDEFEKVVKSFKTMIKMKDENLVTMLDRYYTLEKEYAEVKVNIKKSIEEMNELARHKVRPISFEQAVAIDMCIGILKRKIGEER